MDFFLFFETNVQCIFWCTCAELYFNFSYLSRIIQPVQERLFIQGYLAHILEIFKKEWENSVQVPQTNITWKKLLFVLEKRIWKWNRYLSRFLLHIFYYIINYVPNHLYISALDFDVNSASFPQAIFQCLFYCSCETVPKIYGVSSR